ncbi:MAG: radical SAM protein [Planctomycetota bacterium]|jgi:hypothetical protein
MKLTGLHLLLTYECTYECDHCFVWSSPRQSGTMTLDQIEQLLEQADALGDIEWIYFEGGEPFLYYAVLLAGVRAASLRGFRVGIVSNAYWATEVKDAVEWLRPLAGLIEQLSISSDLYHGSEKLRPEAKNACAAAGQLGIPAGVISIAQPEAADAACAVGQLPEGESALIYPPSAPGASSRPVRTRICESRGACTWIRWATFTSARGSRWATWSGRAAAPRRAPARGRLRRRLPSL